MQKSHKFVNFEDIWRCLKYERTKLLNASDTDHLKPTTEQPKHTCAQGGGYTPPDEKFYWPPLENLVRM